MDNFTADSLQNFIRQPPARSSILDEEMELSPDSPNKANRSQIPGAPRTARAKRIGEILENASARPTAAHAQAAGPAAPQGHDSNQSAGPRYHDQEIRKHMGEMIRVMLAEGRHADLAVILQNHQGFIQEVLNMIQQQSR